MGAYRNRTQFQMLTDAEALAGIFYERLFMEHGADEYDLSDLRDGLIEVMNSPVSGRRGTATFGIRDNRTEEEYTVTVTRTRSNPLFQARLSKDFLADEIGKLNGGIAEAMQENPPNVAEATTLSKRVAALLEAMADLDAEIAAREEDAAPVA